MEVSIVGTGYVGLGTGACLAEKGHEVACIDVDAVKVDRINRGESPIFEPARFPTPSIQSTQSVPTPSPLHSTSSPEAGLKGAV